MERSLRQTCPGERDALEKHRLLVLRTGLEKLQPFDFDEQTGVAHCASRTRPSFCSHCSAADAAGAVAAGAVGPGLVGAAGATGAAGAGLVPPMGSSGWSGRGWGVGGMLAVRIVVESAGAGSNEFQSEG